MRRDMCRRVERQVGDPGKALLTDVGSSKTDLKLMGCDPVFWVQKARSRFPW